MTVPVPERRGDWPGTTRHVRDCLAPDGTRQVPVCPLCAKALLHTADEHDQLEAAHRTDRQQHDRDHRAVPPPEQRPDRPMRTVHAAGDVL